MQQEIWKVFNKAFLSVRRESFDLEPRVLDAEALEKVLEKAFSEGITARPDSHYEFLCAYWLDKLESDTA